MRLADHFRSSLFRIVIAYTILFITSAVALFSFLYWSVSREMENELRAAIEEDARPIIAAYNEGRLQRMVEAVQERADAAKPGETLILLQTLSGRVLAGNVARFPPFAGWRELVVRTVAPLRPGTGRPEVALVLGIRFEDAFLLVGRSLTHIAETHVLLIRSLAWTLALMVALALVGGAVFSRAALRRIETINRTFLEVAEGNFSRRVPTRGTRDELDRLAVNINQMLERIEHLLDNLQQVTNDIAHDLRTPLGHLRQGLEGARLKGVSVEEYQTAIDHAIEEVDTILETFAALLRIAQVESRSRRDRFTDVDLSEVSNRVIDAYESVVEDAGQTLTWSIANGIEVRGDKNLLAQLLANLIENASRHCPAGTPIRVSLGRDPAPVLEVADNGAGIPADMREAVLRRFVRLEQSRTSPGSGLGLAVVKAIADLHDARLKLDDNGPGLRVTLTFPALQPVNPNS